MPFWNKCSTARPLSVMSFRPRDFVLYWRSWLTFNLNVLNQNVFLMPISTLVMEALSFCRSALWRVWISQLDRYVSSGETKFDSVKKLFSRLPQWTKFQSNLDVYKLSLYQGGFPMVNKVFLNWVSLRAKRPALGLILFLFLWSRLPSKSIQVDF